MPPLTEIEAITSLDNLLSKLQDGATRDRVLQWAWEKYSTKPSLSLQMLPTAKNLLSAKSKKHTGRKTKSSRKSKPKLSIVKDLNLSPKGKKSFKQFAQEKQPTTNQEKCTLAIYYLGHELGLSDISINHIYTCYKNINWRVADLYNVLTLTAHRKGWVDTSNMDAIAITTHGENLVDHDLPRQPKVTG